MEAAIGKAKVGTGRVTNSGTGVRRGWTVKGFESEKKEFAFGVVEENCDKELWQTRSDVPK